jgi:hypothetical protein
MILANVPAGPYLVGAHDGCRAVGQLGANPRELAALRYGVMDRPDRPVAPFRLPSIRLDDTDSQVMLEIIESRLEGRLWDEISATDTRAEDFVSREFNIRDAAEKNRPVGDFGHLSDHYDRISTKNETLFSKLATGRPHNYCGPEGGLQSLPPA